MSINIQADILTHSTTANRVTTFRIFPDGGLGIRMRNGSDRLPQYTIDELSRADRIELAQFLMQGIETNA